MPDHSEQESRLPSEAKPVILKDIPIGTQAEKLIRVRREVVEADEMTRVEQIEFDASNKAEAILRAAKTEAEKILTDAKNEAASIREKSRVDGISEAKQAALDKLQSLLTTLENEINQTRIIRAGFLEENLCGIIDFSCAIAGKIMINEMKTCPEAISERARILLERMPPNSNVILTASHEDIDVIQTYLTDLGGPSDKFSTSLRSDPELPSGCLRLESDSGRIDAGFITVLDELGGILKEQACHIADGISNRQGDGNGG